MRLGWSALALSAVSLLVGVVRAHAPAPVAIDIVGPDGATFREIPVDSRDDAQRAYLQADKGTRYQVRVRNTTGERLGLVIAVDGRNIINGQKSDLARGEPMYILDAWETENYAGWRAGLDAINEFYFTDWKDSYAEAFGDRTARGVIAVAVFREVPPAPPVQRPYLEEQRGQSQDPAASAPTAKSDNSSRRDESAGTGYGERRIDHAVQVEFVAESNPASRHFIKYEWRETLCRKHLLDCGESNRFWDESALSFAPPPPRR